MITEETFPVEPWQVRETTLDLDLLAQSESVFALSNGHIGLRGNLDEGEPHGLPGTYLNSFFEIRPLPYAEAGYGYPEQGQTIVDVTNGKILRLLVDDEPFDVRYGELQHHERVLDFRAGTLTRSVRWRSPAGRQVAITTTRLVSLAQRGVAAIEYVVEAVDEFTRMTVQSELVANEDQPETSGDPRASAIVSKPLHPVSHDCDGARGVLVHRTRLSELTMAAAMDHDVEVPGRVEVHTDAFEDLARTTVICGLRPGQKLRIVKYLAYGWSSLRSRPALHDQVDAALTGARYTGLAGAARRSARLPGRLLGQCRRRGGGRSELSAGGALRAVPRAAGQRPRRASRHRGQGAHRTRLRRPRLLGHRGIRAPGADVHAAERRRRRAALAGVHTRTGAAAGPGTGPCGRELSLAHHSRAGVFGVLARGHRRMARQRRHRRRVRALSHRHRRPVAGSRVRPGGADRDGEAVGVPRPSRPPRRVAPRRGHGPGRVHRRGARQRIHQPDGRP